MADYRVSVRRINCLPWPRSPRHTKPPPTRWSGSRYTQPGGCRPICQPQLFLFFLCAYQKSDTPTGPFWAPHSAGWCDQGRHARPDLQEQWICKCSWCCKITTTVKDLPWSCILWPRLVHSKSSLDSHIKQWWRQVATQWPFQLKNGKIESRANWHPLPYKRLYHRRIHKTVLHAIRRLLIC
jgi:hypothetical protein